MSKLALQEYADQIVSEPYRQPLKSLEDALAVHGWDVIRNDDDSYNPWCCGTPVDFRSFLGGAYHAECFICGNFIHDMTGPSFGNSYVNVIDTDKIDVSGNTWIAGTAPIAPK